MEKILMIYSIPKGDDIIRITFNRRLFKYNIQSHKGKYKARTNGILAEFEKPVRSCVIFHKDKLIEVKQLCNELKIISKFYEIKKV